MYKLSHTLTKIYNYYLPTCFAKSIELNLDLEDPSITTASPSNIKDTLTPLVEAAIARIDKKGSITIRASKEKSHIIISISDTGVALTRSEQAAIETKKIEVTSRHGYGTTITLTTK